MATRNHIDLVAKTIRILEILANRETPMELKDISAEAGLVKSSVFRILYTLRNLDYVEQVNGHSGYQLTLRVLDLARKSEQRPSLINVIRPHLQRIRDQLNESAWFAIHRKNRVVMVDVAESHHPLRLSFAVGDACPVHATALGKAVAAFLTPAERKEMLASTKLTAFTRKTITDRAKIDAELAKVHRRGYATNNEESILGAVTAGAPVFDSEGSVIGAISVTVPTARWSSDKRRRTIETVRSVAQAITKDLRRAGLRIVEPR